MLTYKMAVILKKLRDFLSPIRLMGFMDLGIALIDNLSNPLEHNPLSTSGSIIEIILQAIAMFCGIFAIMGNGRTRRIRAIVVSLPILYLAILYTISYINTQTHVLLLPILFLWLTSLWLILVGDNYERRAYSIDSNRTNNIGNEHTHQTS